MELWNDGLGSENKQSGDLELYIQFRPEKAPDDVESGQPSKLTARYGTEKTKVFDLTKFLNAWESLPPLKPPVPLQAADQAEAAKVAEVPSKDLSPGLPQA
jgi:hypothetical protein